ncbi:ankyrin repeat domain-containing protein [Sphingobacterium sp. LRF_L2]|uniref:ankyrin repeat domain-containing protein n=1 Tax=Sphingobacterium sp. LRF_L2 TaxID=3369421 RepID=UPI003F61E529
MKFLLLLLLAIVVFSCSDHETYLSSDFQIFKGTKSWKLAALIRSDDSEGIKKEISKNKSLLSFQESKYGMTVLHLAIIHKKMNAFKTLLSLGFNLDLYDFDNGASPFLLVCGELDEKEYYPYYLMLVKHGADVNQKLNNSKKNIDVLDYSALMYAISKGNKKIVENLLLSGAQINYRSSKDRNAFSVAVHSNRLDLAYFLMMKGADCNARVFTKYDAYQKAEPVYACEYLQESKFLTKDEYFYMVRKLIIKKGCCKTIESGG